MPTTKIRVQREGAVPSLYANHVQVWALPEEVYLDLCTIDLDGAVHAPGNVPVEVPATVHLRVVVSRQHARRIAESLLGVVGDISKPPSPTGGDP